MTSPGRLGKGWEGEQPRLASSGGAGHLQRGLLSLRPLCAWGMAAVEKGKFKKGCQGDNTGAETFPSKGSAEYKESERRLHTT